VSALRHSLVGIGALAGMAAIACLRELVLRTDWFKGPGAVDGDVVVIVGATCFVALACPTIAARLDRDRPWFPIVLVVVNGLVTLLHLVLHAARGFGPVPPKVWARAPGRAPCGSGADGGGRRKNGLAPSL